MIEQYKAMRLKEGSAPASVNRELACFKHLYTMAIKWRKANVNPVKEVKLFKEKLGPVRVLSRDEEKKLLDAACDHLKPIVVTALNTGMRKGEILRLRWNRVDFINDVITVEDSKNGETREIPMNHLLKGLLQDLLRKSRSGYVFSDKEGKPFGDVKKGFCAAARKFVASLLMTLINARL